MISVALAINSDNSSSSSNHFSVRENDWKGSRQRFCKRHLLSLEAAKAKALKQFIEPLVTKSKEDTTHNRRICFSYLRSKYAVTELFREVAAKVGDRPGGYTRIIKLGNRLGDN